MNLFEKTIELLKNRSRTVTIPEISLNTGVGEAWISKFANGHIKNPSVNHVEKVYNFLTNDKLKGFLNEQG